MWNGEKYYFWGLNTVFDITSTLISGLESIKKASYGSQFPRYALLGILLGPEMRQVPSQRQMINLGNACLSEKLLKKRQIRSVIQRRMARHIPLNLQVIYKFIYVTLHLFVNPRRRLVLVSAYKNMLRFSSFKFAGKNYTGFRGDSVYNTYCHMF